MKLTDIKDNIVFMVLEIAFIILWKLKYWRIKKMRSVNNYQSIRTPEDEEYERDVEIAFENLVEYYADDISEKGMNWMQKSQLMQRARKIVNTRR